VHLDELARRATQKLDAPIAEYFNQGARAGFTTAEASLAWERYRFRPRMLRDVSRVSTATTILGQALATPILIAPTALQRAAHPDGELAMARATAAAGSLLEVSTNSGSTFEEIAAEGAPWWLQVYVMRDRGLTAAMLKQAVAAGASAAVLTVDTPDVGEKWCAGPSAWDVVPDIMSQVNIDAAGLPDSALDKADDLTPDVIGWLRDITGLPVVVKGVLRADDAMTMVSAGAAAVQVSNHGGRQLDFAVSTAEALPEVADALAGSGTEVYVDGGIRCAEHVLAALALGADAVFIGRPALWALAAGGDQGDGGADGVSGLLAGFTAGLRHVMMLAGISTIGEISADLVCR